MNIVLAIVVLTGVYMVHDEEPAFVSQPAVIDALEQGSPAEKAGVKTGDRITQIQNIANPTWQQVFPEILINPGQPVEVALQRGNQIIHTRVIPVAEGPDRIGAAGWQPEQAPVVGDLDSGLPAVRAGIKVGDEIVTFNAERVTSMSRFNELLQENKSNPVQLGVQR